MKKIQKRMTIMIKGIKTMPHENWLKELGSFSLKKGKPRWNIPSSNILRGIMKKKD